MAVAVDRSWPPLAALPVRWVHRSKLPYRLDLSFEACGERGAREAAHVGCEYIVKLALAVQPLSLEVCDGQGSQYAWE